MKIVISASATMILAFAISFFSAEAAFADYQFQEKTEATSEGDRDYVKGITPARARSLVGGAMGLASVIVGFRARKRSPGDYGAARRWSISALILGVAALILSIVHLSGTTGGFGTGGGKAGAIVALVLGIIGVVLGALAFRTAAK